MSHENKKPNVCEACGAKFARADALRRHTRKCAEFQQMGEAAEQMRAPSPNRDTAVAAVQWSGPAPKNTVHQLGQRMGSAIGEATVPNGSVLTASLSPHSVRTNPRSVDGQLTHIDSVGSHGQSLTEQSPNRQYPSGMVNLDLNTSQQSPDMQRRRQDLQPFSVNAFANSHTYSTGPPGMMVGDPGMPLFAEAADFQISSSFPPNIELDEDMAFLEEFLFPEYTFNRKSIPAPAPAPGIIPEKLEESSYVHALFISPEDVAEFEKHFIEADSRRQLTNFVFPRQSRIIRCLTAYFEYFDPHAPIIQHATFSVAGASPALVLAMLALGALYIKEHKFATPAYEAACILLADFVGDQNPERRSTFQFWPVQASLLCVQFGAFSDNEVFARRAQQQFACATEMLRDGLQKMKVNGPRQENDWASWSLNETFSRLASWTCALSATILANDPADSYVAPYQLLEISLPRNEEYWQARSAQEWNSGKSAAMRYNNLDFSSLTRSLLRGESISENISSFGLLSLVGWILSSVCHHEKLMMSMGPIDVFGNDFTIKIELALAAWEVTFRRYLRTDQFIFRPTDPLLSDCFPLLGSAYYHLLVGDQLRTLKGMADRPASVEASSMTWGTLPAIRPVSSVRKAVRYAANSILIRARMGLGHYQYMGPLNYGGYVISTICESALLLSWWLVVAQLSPGSGVLSEGEEDEAGNKSLEDIIADVFTELEDQDIPCTDPVSRVLAPLVFSRQTIPRCIYASTVQCILSEKKPLTTASQSNITPLQRTRFSV
ncbi:uncharacterized protein N7482_000034 [Penicillium canariense]|uniref:C2H2-type domain-containing protein n=1 Tax=Penicillium canariense TaxID=189055 RepID=A0A9W9ID28_9EURO|nr:uncharacterized protein N7482_000034 [Penicillium canariense]KAJ5174157.1 hypothetical protein N7482_000034 [Penicillium canariense]